MKWSLSKSRLLGFSQCPKRLYQEVHFRHLMEYSVDTDAVFTSGQEVGRMAQKILAPDGVLVEYDPGLRKAVTQTESLMEDMFTRSIYEATFLTGNLRVRVDLLEQDKDLLTVTEVKSSTGVKELYYADCAIQYWVLDQCGYRPDTFQLAHINNRFVYPGEGDYEGLFRLVDLTEQVSELAESVPQWVDEANQVIAGELPIIDTGDHCTRPYACPFIAHCSKVTPQIEYPLERFPGLRKPTRIKLQTMGLEDVRDIPADMLTTERQRAILRACQTGRALMPDELTGFLRTLAYPRYYFDFETIGFAVPIWPGTRPYQSLPFQWSCHRQDGSDELEHTEFLDTSGEPPMRSCTEALIEALGESGPILVYSSYERGVLKNLALMFPELAAPIEAIIDRLVDLYIPIKQHYYHRDMQGSFSLKKVLPTIVPDLSYSDLEEVRDGMMAQQAFLELINTDTNRDRKNFLKDALLKYCELDTLAMVRMVDNLTEHAKSNTAGTQTELNFKTENRD